MKKYTPKLVPFNINQCVYVRLTRQGKAMLREKYAAERRAFSTRNRRLELHLPKEDEDGWSRWQLWSLMHEFGDVISIGTCILPFEMDILIELPKR